MTTDVHHQHRRAWGTYPVIAALVGAQMVVIVSRAVGSALVGGRLAELIPFHSIVLRTHNECRSRISCVCKSLSMATVSC